MPKIELTKDYIDSLLDGLARLIEESDNDNADSAQCKLQNASKIAGTSPIIALDLSRAEVKVLEKAVAIAEENLREEQLTAGHIPDSLTMAEIEIVNST